MPLSESRKRRKAAAKRSGARGSKKLAQASAVESAKKFFIVGIGASAGGFEPLTRILQELPRDINAAFVLVQHLDPKHKSSLVELLSRVSVLPVEEIRSGTRVQPRHVYVIPPQSNVILTKGHLMLAPRRSLGINMPVDQFLRSLASEEENCAVGVILSGTGSDGTLGIQAIKGQGFKVQSQLQDQQIRVTGKKRDDLQDVIAFVRGKDFGVATNFTVPLFAAGSSSSPHSTAFWPASYCPSESEETYFIPFGRYAITCTLRAAAVPGLATVTL
jgi:hypothetical protein